MATTPHLPHSANAILASSAPYGPISTHPHSVPQLPSVHPPLRFMTSDGRSRRRELVEEAYKLQVKAGLMARHVHLTDLPSSLRILSLLLTRDDLNPFSHSWFILPCTGRGAIWRIWVRFCNLRASFLARFSVSQPGQSFARVLFFSD
jgi:hypothetical protein